MTRTKFEVYFPIKVKVRAEEHVNLQLLTNHLLGKVGSVEYSIIEIDRFYEINFNRSVDVTWEGSHFADIVSRICKYNTPKGHVMWPSGSGSRIEGGWGAVRDDAPIPFNDDVFHVGVCLRED